jgi:type IV fimbrial biogenesis protein FimT
MKSPRSSVSGFTLTELMVVLAVAAILATMAVPSFKSLVQSQRLKNAGFELYSSLALARNEAIKRNSDVTMATTTNANGELSWVITAFDGTVIRNQDFIKDIAFDITGLPGTDVVYHRNGRPESTATFEIDALGAATPFVRCLTIELSGMPRIRMGACS